MRFVGVDPATVTGFVALDEQGNVIEAVDLKGEGKTVKGGITAQKLVSLENNLFKAIQPHDEIVIEDAAVGTQRGITTGMIHGGLRTMIVRKGLLFNIVSPNAVKKYVGVSGWKGEKGSKIRLKDAEKKAAVKEAVLSHFGYTHKSDNVIDAYVIARIAWNLYLYRELYDMVDTEPYQIEVVKDILTKTDS